MTTPSGERMRSISDTARLVAYHRAMETERADAIFRDPYARTLAGESGERFARTLRWGRRGAWSTIVRTRLLDEEILKILSDGSTDVVLNLAAGLDARPYRMDLPASLRWVEVDLPEILTYKEQRLSGEKPKCRLERAALDLTRVEDRRALLRRVNDAAQTCLVVSEGLLIYLEQDQVAALAEDLHEQGRFALWLTDIVGSMVVRRMNQMLGRSLRSAGAAVRFGPPEGSAFFSPFGWRQAEFCDLLDGAQDGRQMARAEERALP